jgi:hypothetical protein
MFMARSTRRGKDLDRPARAAYNRPHEASSGNTDDAAGSREYRHHPPLQE